MVNVKALPIVYTDDNGVKHIVGEAVVEQGGEVVTGRLFHTAPDVIKLHEFDYSIAQGSYYKAGGN